MPKVNVKYFANLRELMGMKEEKYRVEDGTTLMDLLLNYIPDRHRNASESWKRQVFETEKGDIRFDKEGLPSVEYLVLINGISCNSIREGKACPGLKYRLKNEDYISILPPVGGG